MQTYDNKIFQEYTKGIENDRIPDQEIFLTNSDRDISLTAVNLVFTPYQLSPNWLKNNIFVITEESELFITIKSSILSFKVRWLDRMVDEIQKKLKNPSSLEEERSLLKTFYDLKMQSSRINREDLRRIVLR